MPNPTAAMLVIGDEILSGRTQDANTPFLAAELVKIGIDLHHVRIVRDDRDAIVKAVKSLSVHFDEVFTSGGIGPTHDDITADCVAAAMRVDLDVRADARAILEAHYAKTGSELNSARLRMARIPKGAILIDNPISAAPGFSLDNVHVMAGVPAIFQAMVAGLLPRLVGGAPVLSRSWRVEKGEGEIAAPLGELAQDFPNLSFGSYPFAAEGKNGANLVVRGQDKTQLDRAYAALQKLFPQ